MKKERENSYSMAQEYAFSNITMDRIRNFSNFFFIFQGKGTKVLRNLFPAMKKWKSQNLVFTIQATYL